MKTSSRRGLIGGLLAGVFLTGVNKTSFDDFGSSTEELADRYLQQSGFWDSLSHAIHREAQTLVGGEAEAFREQALVKLRQKYIAHFMSHLDRADFSKLLQMNEDESTRRFNQACLQMNAEAKKMMSEVFAEVRAAQSFRQA